MGQARHTVKFLFQSAVAGLAVAFVVVFLFPGLLPSGHPLRGDQAGPGSFAAAVAATAPAVVNLVGRAAVAPGFEERQASGSLGSGVVMNGDGYVITNHHVIAGMEDLSVVLVDGRSAPARLVGTDPETDIALLRIELPDLPSIRVGRSDQLEVGDVVLAIGNPFSIGQTVTQGIVSGTGRGQLGLSQFENFIQTDAAINVGNSGGALVNARGELVGINTAFFSRRLDSEGIGFAIPINLVRGVMSDLVQHGRVIRGWLGVGTQTLTPDQARALGLPEPYGIILTTVQAGGPAARAGLRPNDIITHVNGEPVVVWQDALRSIAAMPPGTKVTLSGNRRGQSFEVEAEVAERPARL
ncbi:trypsin-like peptidase domain-containing protein [Thioalkalivibrio sp. XN8]|uniref:S1C family serine protease n=1 Tax=Thioalkalivibrio sp. XN8 TaxID=2712863 RepID=UPI0013ECB820|nr:trypsin-like peptidase domain-containing protein [Thioalkalivibrio sp. XN8]NGP52195.1 PDZ domain-containing protein [Thioalkalivibrio sp. XN8]